MKVFRSVLSLVLTALLLLSSMPLAVFADSTSEVLIGWDGSIADGFDSGSGTEDDPYVIKSGAQLAYFASSVNSGERFEEAFVVLGADILLNDVTDWEQWGREDSDGLVIAPTNSWTPIGDYFINPFGGTFDGNGYVIRGLYIRSYASSVGLFGTVSDASLQNVRLEESVVVGCNTSQGEVGGICGGASDTELRNCVNGATVIAAVDYAGIGGVVGSVNRGAVTDCENRGLLQGGGVYADVGGVVGSADATTVSSCRNLGAIVGEDTRINVGGVVGGASSATVQACVNEGAVGGDGVYANVGGVIGNASDTTVRESANFVALDGGREAYVGGVTGYLESGSEMRLCLNRGDLRGASLMGGLAGEVTGRAQVSNCYSDGDLVNTGSYTEVGGLVGELYSDSHVSMCYAAGTLQSADENLTGGTVGDKGEDCTVEDCYYLDSLPSDNAFGQALSAEQLKTQDSFPGWNFRSVWELDVDETYTYPTLRVFGSKTYLYRVILKDGGTVLSSKDYQPGATVDLTPPVKSDCDFAYWRAEDGREFTSESTTASEELTLTAVWMPKRSSDTAWDGTVDTAWEGSGTADDPYLIGTPAELAGVAAACREHYGWDRNTVFRLTADLVMNEGGERFSETMIGRFEWTPIGLRETSFCATFDGNGHTISGIWCYSIDETVGLFGFADRAIIRDLTLNASYLRGGTTVGGIVGKAYECEISGCAVDATVHGADEVGGVIGNSYGDTVSACENRGAVCGVNRVGGMVGRGYETNVVLCNNRGEIYGASDVGGVVGSVSDGAVTACVNYGAVNGTKEQVGGIAGYANAVRCANYGDVNGRRYVGGIAGQGSATDSYSLGTVCGDSEVGGVLAYGTVVRCYNAGAVQGYDYVGPLLYSGTATDSYYLDTAAESNGYGTALSAQELTAADSFDNWNFLSVWELGFEPGVRYPTLRDIGSRDYAYRVTWINGDTVLRTHVYRAGETVDLTPPVNSEYDFAYWRREDQRAIFASETVAASEDLVLSAVWSYRRTSETAWDGSVDTDWAGGGTAEDPYRITSAAELAGVAAVNDARHGWSGKNAHFLLTTDILLNDGGAHFTAWVTGKHAWTPIGVEYPFYGHFDGGGHTVEGLYCYEAGENVGLFGKLGGTVTNLTVSGSYVRGEERVGAVVGYVSTSSASVNMCTSDSTVVGSTEVGGVVGSGRVFNSTNRGTVSGERYIGGIVGEGPASGCVNFGTVSGEDYVGGVIAFTYDGASGCRNEGTVSGAEYVGGVVGSTHGEVTNSINLGTVSGDESVGGLVGSTHNKVTNCYNLGTVSGAEYIGGIVGYTYDEAVNCYNGGEIVGNESVGGVCGIGDAVTSYNLGTVSGRRYVGAVTAGRGTTTDCYYAASSAVQDAYATLLTEEQMKAAESFVGFDFAQYWTIDPTADYPYPTLTGVPHRVFFTVTYKDIDGSTLMTERVEKGGRPSFAAPYEMLLEDEDHVYRFEGWDRERTEVEQDLTITAVRSKIEKQVLLPIALTMTVEYGYSPENLKVDAESLMRRVVCTTTTGYRVMSDVVWDLSAYDPDVSGVCVLQGQLSLLQSPYYKAADETAVTLSVTVAQEDDRSHLFREEDLRFEELADGTVAIIGYAGAAQRVVIPATLDGKTVTTIADGAFRDQETILSVTLPVTLTSIGAEAFAGCAALCEAALPDSLQAIGARAFADTALTSVTCGEQVLSIGEAAFGFDGETAMAGFTVCGYADSAAAVYAQEHGFDYVVIVAVEDVSTGVSAVIQENTILSVTQVTDGAHFEAATQILERTDGVQMYDMTLYDTSEEAVQPDSMITFRVPVPDTFAAEDCLIFRVNDDGSFMNMHAMLDDGQLVFRTSHLSYYAIIDAGEKVLVGDIDGNGAINTMDALRLYAAMGGSGSLTPTALAAADINGDGLVNTMDALMLYKTASGR